MAIDPSYRARANEFLAICRRWHSEVSSWEVELMFLQRMLDIYGLKAEDGSQTERLRSLRSRMIRLLKDDSEKLKERLNQHGHHLTLIVEDRLLLQDRELAYKHGDVEREMLSSRQLYQSLHESAFALIEELKRN